MSGTKGHSVRSLSLPLIIAQSLASQASMCAKDVRNKYKKRKKSKRNVSNYRWIQSSMRVGIIDCSLSIWNSLASTNNYTWLEQCKNLKILPAFVPHRQTFEITSQAHAFFFLAICFCFKDRQNWLDKWLYLTERPFCLTVFWSKYCHEVWLSTGKMRSRV